MRPSKFGQITSEDERPPNYIEFSKGLHYRAAMADFWETRPPQWQPHPLCATFYPAKSTVVLVVLPFVAALHYNVDV